MTGTLTSKFNVNLVKNFIDDVNSSSNRYFIFTSRSVPWINDSNPPPSNNSPTVYDQDVYDNILYGKVITNNNIIPSIKRYDWANNTKYIEYDKDNKDLFTGNNTHYVYNTASNVRAVFKVIESGQGNSIVAPSIITTTPFRTSDGYLWKYMYSISESDDIKFGTSNTIPLIPNTSVTSSATPGSIDAIKILNGGTGWYVFNTGTIQKTVNTTCIIVSNTASSNNDFYTGSSIYLKSGMGSGQIRTISSYDGVTKTISVDVPFNIKTNIVLANVAGQFNINDTVSQNLVSLAITSLSGYIEPGDTIIQSKTNATGTVVTANTTFLRVVPLTSTAFNNIDVIDGNRGTTLGNSTVTTSTSSNTVTAASNAQFLTFYSTGSYIKVGQHVHRVVSVANNTSLTIAGPFTNTYISNSHFRVLSAATVSSVSDISSNGTVTFTDLTGAELTINNQNGIFNLGEIVTQSTTSTNGTISFANTTKLIISNIQGPGFTTNSNVQGVLSNATANVLAVASNPSVTIENIQGNFVSGVGVTSTSGGSGRVNYTSFLPNEQTEYVISPRVVVSGDGTGAAGYCIVNTSTTSIQSIVMVSTGVNYSHANATLVSNPNYGSNCVLKPLISPIGGHGSDPALELNASYVSLLCNFGNTSSDNYNLPGSAQFRSVGIIKNPKMDDIHITIGDYSRVRLALSGANTFNVGNIVRQANLAAGIVIFSNTSFVEVGNVKGMFDKLAANVILTDTTTSTTSAISNVNINTFTATVNNYVYQEVTGAKGKLLTSNTTVVRLTDVTGVFQPGYTIYDPSTNAHASATAIRTANNTKLFSFDYFNNTVKLPLSQNTGSFSINEDVEIRTPTGSVTCTGTVFNTNNNVDFIITGINGTFTNNEVVVQGSANGVVAGANSSYVRLTNIKGIFTVGSSIVGQVSSANANISQILPVLTLSGIKGTVAESNTNIIVGLTSNAQGFCAISNTIIRSNLVRDTGDVIYTENVQPVNITDNGKQRVKLTLNFNRGL